MHRRIFALFFLFIFYFPSVIFSQPNTPYHARRQHLITQMKPNSFLILHTSSDGYRFGYGFQQNSDLFYLTGMNERDIFLILSTNGIPSPIDEKNVHEILIYDPPGMLFSEREKYYRSLEDSLPFDLVCGRNELRKIIKSFQPIESLYTNILKQNQTEASSILEKRLLRLTEDNPKMEIMSVSPLTRSMRRVKDNFEISLMQKAIDITIEAQKEAFKSMAPGLYEYQIEAVIEYIFKTNGSQQLAFDTIVGAGPNSLELHYSDGLRKIQAGDMIVMDIGCEFDHYCADITRTIPATGKFTPEQKEIYNIVLESQEAVIDMLKPGITLAQMDSTVKAVAAKYGYEKYIRHGCTHYLGLDVHDVGDNSKPLEPGCVITVEPGLYIPPDSDLPKAYWNIGIRIEDDVLITTDGNRVLSGALMKSVDEIEKFMKQDGMVQILSE